MSQPHTSRRSPLPTHVLRPIPPGCYTPLRMHTLRLVCIISLMAILSACGSDSLIEWGYTGPGAPERWASLSPDFAACANGKQQSPIDITGYQSGGPGPISFSYATAEATLRNDGRQVHADYAPGNTAMLGGREFKLKSVHFHSPSEHLVDGESFAAELHMVHADSDGRLAVVGLLFTLGDPSPVAQSILDAAPPPDGTANASISPSPVPSPPTSPTTATTAPRPLHRVMSPSTGTSYDSQ